MNKTMIVIATLFILGTSIKAQSVQLFFDKYSDDERFEYVSVGKGLMNMAGVFGGLAKDEKALMSKMKFIKILSLQEDINSALMKTLSREVDLLIQKGNFETAVEVRDKGQRVLVYYRVQGDNNADMMIVTKEKDELTVIWISGKMTKKDMMNSFSNVVKMNDSIS